MFIRSTQPAYSSLTRKANCQSHSCGNARSQALPESEPNPPFQELAVRSAIVGASLGTMAGEKIGQIGFVGGSAYTGYALGSFYGEVGGMVGGAIGAGLGYLAEDKMSIGKTIGGAAGFVSGGILGGVTGSVIFGASSVINSDFFKKS